MRLPKRELGKTILLIALLFMGLASMVSSPAHATSTPSKPLSASSGSQSIAPWSLPHAQVSFDKDQVLLTVNGKKRIVAHDTASRLDPGFTHLGLVSPNGQWLLYVTADDRRWKNTTLNLVNLSSLQKSVIATFSQSFWPQVRWSPDSQQIAYVLVNTTTQLPEIFIMDAQGGHKHLVVSQPTFTKASLLGYEDVMYGWSVDGRSLLYYDNALPPHTRYVVSLTSNAGGTAPQQTMSTQVAPLTTSVPTTPCNAPLFMQTDPAWSGNIMQSAGDTIGKAGCALTSATMAIDYYAGSQIYNPATMNTCMGNYADGFTWGYAATTCSQGKAAWQGWTQWDLNNPGPDWTILNNELSAGHPTIVGITWNSGTYQGQHHYVLVVSGDGSNNTSNYVINDPLYGSRRLLSDLVPSQASFYYIMPYHPTGGSWPACMTGGSSGGSSNINNQDVFSIGANGHLYDSHWSLGNNNWTSTDLTAQVNGPAGVMLTGTPSANTFTWGTTPYQHVMVMGNNGHLYEFGQIIGQSWYLNDLYTKATSTPPAGVTLGGSPISMSITASGVLYHSASVIGSDGHLYNYGWNSGNNWTVTLTDLTAQVNGPTGVQLTGNPGGNTFFWGSNPYQHILVTGNNGHQYEYGQIIGQSWYLNDLYAQSGTILYGRTLSGSPVSISFTVSGVLYHSVSVIGSDGHLYNYGWNSGNNWKVILSDLSATVNAPTGGFLTSSTPGGDPFIYNGSSMQHFLVTGSDGHLYEYGQVIGQSWFFSDLTSRASASITITGSPWSQSYMVQGTLGHSVYVVTNDGHLYEFCWNSSNSSTWNLIDHGVPSGAGVSNSTPTGTAY